MIVHRFLLVSLSIEAILAETTIHRRKEKLEQMSKGQDVEDVYTATFKRIKGQENARSRLGMEAIMWVAYSERPLQPDELCQALGVEVGSKDLNKDNAPKIRTIMNCALGLVTVDSSSSTVRLVHFTLQEYILANPTLFQSPHSMIAEVCLTYLNFAYIRGLSSTLSAPPPTTPFLEYASCHWGAHARREISESAIPLALKLLDGFDAHVSCKLLLLKEGWGYQYFDTGGGRPIRFTGLHGGAFLGVLEIIVSSFDIRRWDLNATDLRGRTALAWAVWNGYDRDVKILLEQEGVIPDTADNEGETPLSSASGHGHSEIVKMLLERGDVNPNAIDNEGNTPLSSAVICECRDVVEILSGRNNVSLNAAGRRGRTPLAWAAWFGDVVFMEILLGQKDVDPDAADKSGRTPLSLAAGRGGEEAMKLLLKRKDVNTDKVDEGGRTPLSWAVVGWVDEEDNYGNIEGRSNLVGDIDAFRSERTIAVKMLLERNDVNPDKADKGGRTPLSWAASYGYEEIVEILLERNDVNPDTQDERGRTPFSWAVIYGHEKVVGALLDRNNANPDTVDLSGRTPLSWAAERGFESIAEMLLQRSDVNPGTVGESGRTLLSWAAGYGCKGIVKILLERSDVTPDRADMSGRTPLSWAAQNYQEGIVEMLLERNDGNPDTADKGGRTPLSWAAVGWADGPNDYPDTEGSFTSGSECTMVAEMLLKRSDVNPNTEDEDGRTPLSLAAGCGCWEIAEMLLQRSDVNPDTVDRSGRTPLSWAVVNDQEEVVRMLLERNDVNPKRADEDGRTPLSLAAESGYEGITAVNPGVQSVRLWLRTGRTADCDRCPGRTAGVASVLLLARDGLSGRQVSQVAQYANQYWN